MNNGNAFGDYEFTNQEEAEEEVKKLRNEIEELKKQLEQAYSNSLTTGNEIPE